MLIDISEMLTAAIMRASDLMMVAVSTYETQVNFCEATRRNIADGSYLQDIPHHRFIYLSYKPHGAQPVLRGQKLSYVY
jgi:hypothetical protein